jgi:hypothetical protein
MSGSNPKTNRMASRDKRLASRRSADERIGAIHELERLAGMHSAIE